MASSNVTSTQPTTGPGSSFVRTQMLEQQAAPLSSTGPIARLRQRLFSNVPDTILTLVCLYLLYLIIPAFVQFFFTDAQFTGTDRTACATEAQGGIRPDGWFAACWAYVGAYANQFVYGFYPDELQWRPNLSALIFFGGLIPLLFPDAPFKRANILFMLVFAPVAILILLTGGNFGVEGLYIPLAIITAISLLAGYGFAAGTASDPIPTLKNIAFLFGAIFVLLFVLGIDFGLTRVRTDEWGGLLVTLVVAVVGIVASLPLGIALALGRRSQMPVVKFASICFIEFWRGVPLITVLFMASVMLPFFFPEGVTFDKLMRALIGVALFSSAYMAEVVRGGLQALPKGQYEGAQALGLNWVQMMRMIILPQALKLVIPGIVNTFIGLFKDTTLVYIVGLFDFLNIIRTSTTDTTWIMPVQNLTGLSFAAFVYFFFCYAMSRYSMYMERRLDTGHRS
ncbi:MAG: amino acid ABC transporter permease [Pseudomonadota bacterium]